MARRPDRTNEPPPGKAAGPLAPLLLVVDDEPDNLTFIWRTLRRQFRVVCAPDGERALAEMAANPDLAAVVCDQRMPDLSGVDVLIEAQRLAPGAARVLVTAFADADVLAQAINRAHIHRFVPKPCLPDDLVAAVLQSVEMQRRGVDTDRLAAELRRANDLGQRRQGRKPR